MWAPPPSSRRRKGTALARISLVSSTCAFSVPASCRGPATAVSSPHTTLRACLRAHRLPLCQENGGMRAHTKPTKNATNKLINSTDFSMPRALTLALVATCAVVALADIPPMTSDGFYKGEEGGERVCAAALQNECCGQKSHAGRNALLPLLSHPTNPTHPPHPPQAAPPFSVPPKSSATRSKCAVSVCCGEKTESFLGFLTFLKEKS